MTRKKPDKIDRPLATVGAPTLPLVKGRKIGADTKPYDGKTPHLKRATVFAQMPDIYRDAFGPDVTPEEGPGKPPDGFVRATTSGIEWIIYFWLWIILQCEGNVRQPPFFGGRGALGTFTYQVSFFGGRRSPGGTVPDFAVLRPRRALLLRIQGEWQHVFTTATKIEEDLFLKGRLSGPEYEVIDIFEQHILGDPYYRAGTVPRVLQDALEGISWLGPIMGGNPFRSRLPFA